MGFVIFGEILLVRQSRGPAACSLPLEHLAEASFAQATLENAAAEECWGLVEGQSVYITNNLGAADVSLILPLPHPVDVRKPEWRNPAPGTLQSILRTAHGWAYSPGDDAFNAGCLSFEWRHIQVGDVEEVIALPYYKGHPLTLMLPAPNPWSTEQAQAIDRGEQSRWPSEDYEFLSHVPCWPALVRLYQPDGWQEMPVQVTGSTEVALQPTTARLSAKLARMNHILLAHGVFCCDVHSNGHAVKSLAYAACGRISDAQLEALGKTDRSDVPIAWYSLFHRLDWDQTAAIEAEYDPERLVEELHNRFDENAANEPPPGRSEVRIFFGGADSITKTRVGQLIADAAEQANLIVRWDGDPEVAIEVRLPAAT